MFRGWINGITYCSWTAYKRAWNEAVKGGRLFDDKGRPITKLYPID